MNKYELNKGEHQMTVKCYKTLEKNYIIHMLNRSKS